MPMLPAAPPRLSTTTFWPSDCESAIDTIRAMMSVGPPGANGTTSVIGRSGHAADTPGAPRLNRTAAPNAIRPMRRTCARHLTRSIQPSLRSPFLIARAYAFLARRSLFAFDQLVGAGQHFGWCIDRGFSNLLGLFTGHWIDVS